MVFDKSLDFSASESAHLAETNAGKARALAGHVIIHPVLVQREMESRRAPVSEYNANTERIRIAGSDCGQVEGGSRRNRNWFQENGNQFGGSQSQQGAPQRKTNWLRKEY